MEQKLTVIGKVKKVTTFLSYVTLYLDATSPENHRGKITMFTLDNNCCQHLLKWAQLVEGTEVEVTRTENEGIPRNRKYTLKILKSDVIDMDDI